MRMLFINQGRVGAVLGHLSVEASLAAGTAALPGLDSRFVRLPPFSLAQRVLAAPVPGLDGWDLGLQVARVHAVEGWRGRQALARQIACFAPDVVHLDSHVIGLLSADLMRRVPTLLSLDVTVEDWLAMGPDHPARPWSKALAATSIRLQRKAFDAAAGVVTRSDWAARGVRSVHPAVPTHTLHPGLDAARFRPEPRTAPALPRLLFVGGRFTVKGGEDLLAALGGDLGRTVELDVVTASALAPRPGLRVHHLLPGDAALPGLYQQADLTVLPSHADSFGWVLLESMACGTPVLASDRGAMPELVAAAGAGLVVPAGDITALRGAVLGALADPDARAGWGRAGRAHVARHYDQRVQGAALVELARTMLSGTGVH